MSKHRNWPGVRGTKKSTKSARRAIHRSAAAGWETLETRLLMSNTYLINGTQITTNGGTATTFTSPLTLTGTGNTVTIENFGGQATINGSSNSSGDSITVDAGGGGGVAVSDNAAVLQVVAPTTRAANVSVSAGSIALTTGDTVTYGANTASVSLTGQLFSNGDALAITGSGGNTIAVGASTVALGGTPTIYYSVFNGITVNGGMSDNFLLSGDSIPTTLNAGSGNVSFNVSTNSVALAINGGSGSDSYVVNSNSGQLTATGGTGASSFTVYGSSSSMTLNGGSAANSYTIQSNSASLNINGGGSANTVIVNGNSSSITARGGADSTDSFTINSTTGQIGITGGAGSTTSYTISAPTVAAVTITGGSGISTNALTFDGTALNNAFSITTNSVSAGSGASVGFTHLSALTVNGIGGNDSFLVNSDTVPTTLNGAAGNDTFNIQSESTGLTVNTGSGVSAVNIGSNAPLGTGNTLAGLTGAITVTGDSSDSLSLNDASDSTARAVTFNSTSITGLGFAGLTYSGLATMSVKLGSGGNTVAINSTPAATVTNLNTGSGTNTVYLGSSNTSNGVMSNFAGALNLTGGGSDALLINDAGDGVSQTVTLTPTTVTGLSPAAITYNGSTSLIVDLGTAGNSLTLTNTHIGTTTTINGGAGNDTLKVLADASPVALTTGGGADLVSVQSITAATGVTSSGNSVIDVGSVAPAIGGVLAGIAAGLTVTGSNTDTLNIDDSGDSIASTGTLNPTSLHGLGMNSSGITYSGLSNLNLSLGTANNTFTITNTAVGTATNLTGGASADTITLVADSSTTTINSGAGNDQVNVQTTGTITTVNTGAGTDVVYVGNNAPATPSSTIGITAALTVNGGGSTTLDLDDTGDNIARTATIFATVVDGISGAADIYYSGLSAMNLTLGTGGNTVRVNNTAASTVTTINTGAGNDLVNVIGTTGTLNINDGLGTNVVNVGNNSPLSNGVTTNIGGLLNLTGNSAASDTLNLLDASDALPRIVTLAPNTVTGISPLTIAYTGYAALNLYMGTANSSVTVSDTMTGSTLIDTGGGDDNLTLLHDSGPTTIQGSNSSYYIENVAAATTVNALAFDHVAIGNPSGTSRTLAGINAPVNVNGYSTSTLFIGDAADTASKTGTLTGAAITNLSTGLINYQNVSTLNVNLGTAGNTLNVMSTSAPTTIMGGVGADIINIQSDAAALSIAPGLGSNTVNIGSNAPAIHGNLAGITAPVTVTGTGADVLNVDDTGDATSRTAAVLASSSISGLGGATLSYTGQSGVNLSLGNASDVLNITGTALGAATAVHTGNVGTTVNAQSTTGPLMIQSNAADTVNVGSNAPAASVMSSITANLIVAGLGNDTLNLSDSADLSNQTGTVSATAVNGLGATGGVGYTGVAQLNINLGTGSDTVTVNSTAAATTTNIHGTTANAFSVLNTSSAVTITSPGTVLLGSVNNSGGTIAAINGPVTVAGDGTDTLLVQDVADITARTGTLSATQLTLGPAVLNYTGAATLGINLGSGGDSFTINNTAVATPVTLNGGTGTDTLNIAAESSDTAVNAGSATSIINVGTTSHVIDGLAAPLTITGTGTNPLNINDTGSTIAKTGTITGTTISGFNTDGITYAGIGALGISLGSGGNTVLVSSTAASTVSTLNSGSGNDTVNVAGTGGVTNINTQAGNDVTNVLATGATTNVNDGTGTNTVNVGSNAPLNGGVTANIAGALNLTGNSAAIDTLNLLDDADAVSQTAVLTATTMAGISPAVIGFTGFSSVNLNMGTAASTLTVSNTITGNTQINTETGIDAITIQHTSGPTTLITANSTVAVQNIGAATEIDSFAPNQITVGSPVLGGGRTLAGIDATLTLDGTPGSTVLVDDSADATAQIGTLTSTTLTGLSPGAIDYFALASLNVNLGTAGNTLGVTSTNAPTTITGGIGPDTVNIQADSAPLAVALAGGHNTVNIETDEPAGSGLFNLVDYPVTVTGTGIDTLNVNDTADTIARSATLTPTAISGLGGAQINYTGQTAVNLNLGNAIDTLTVTGTSAGTASTVRTGTSGSTINVQATTGPLTLLSGGADTINVGSNAPASSVMSTITANVTVTGLGNDTLNASDASDVTNATGSLSATAITGLGATGTINYTGVSNLNLNLGSSNDTFTVTGTSAATAITGTGTNTIAVTSTTAPLSLNTPGNVNLGTNVTALTGPITITGDGTDVLTLSDTASTLSHTGTLSATQLTLGPASISYTGAATLAVTLGNGADAFTINSTASTTPVTLTGGTGTDTLSIGADSSNTTIDTGSGSSIINVGNAGILAGLTAPLTVAGTGNNPLNINDSASTISESGTLTTTDLTGLNTDGIHFSGISHLAISLGTGTDAFQINSTSTPTTLNAGSGGDSLLLSGTDQTTNGLTAPITINGAGNAQLTLDDTASTTAKTLHLNGATITGLSPAAVSYSNVGLLKIDLGGGHDIANVTGTTAPTTIIGNAGGQNFNLTPGSLTAPVTLTGSRTDPLVVNDSAATTPQTATFAVGEISGLGGPINYTGMATLAATLGNGNDTANITGVDAAVPTTIDGGSGSNTAAINITGNLPGHLTLKNFQTGTAAITGDLTGTLTTDGSFSTVNTGGNLSGTLTTMGTIGTAAIGAALSGTLNTTSLAALTTGGNLSGTVTAGNIGNVAVGGSLGGTLTAAGITTLSTGGDVSGTLTTASIGTANIAGNLSGTLTNTGNIGAITTGGTLNGTLNSGSIGTVTIDGSLSGTLDTTGSIGTATIDGSLTGSLNSGGNITNASVVGNLNGALNSNGTITTATVGGNLGGTLSSTGGFNTVTVAGNLTGTLTTLASIATANITGNLSGTVSAGGNINSLHVNGGFLSTGKLNVTGTLKLLELDGADAGQSNVGSLQGLVVIDVTPTANGTIFSLTQNGVTRSIQAIAANQTTGFTGTTFSTVYDDSTGVPQAAVRVNGGTASQRFDLILNAPATSSFSLSRLDSLNNTATQVRNVVIDGSLLAAVTPAESSTFGYASNLLGGVYLPANNLAAVSARDVMAPGTIWSNSIQGIGYSQLTGSTGDIHPGTRIAVSAFKERLLLSTLVLNPRTHKDYTTVLAPTEPLMVPAGTIAAKTALYAGHAGGLLLDTNGVIVWDRDAGQSALATLTFSTARVSGEQVVNQLAWQGTGGSVQTLRVIQNITSTGALGDVMLGAGKLETLQSITAPSVEGTIDLYGGKLLGTIQTTVGDLGAIDGSSHIEDLQMGSTAQIISRGNLSSSVSITGNLAGTIAADDSIAGDVVVTGKGNSTGSVIAFGSITGPVWIAGSFSGQLAAGGTTGITGNVSISKGLLKGGSVVSDGNIGDATAGTKLTTSSVRGLIVADGTALVRTAHPAGSPPIVESAGPAGNTATAAVLAGVWSPAGTPLTIDESPDDLAGLKQLKAELKGLAISSTGSLT